MTPFLTTTAMFSSGGPHGVEDEYVQQREILFKIHFLLCSNSSPFEDHTDLSIFHPANDYSAASAAA